eukprot:5654630-Alexandrium_andersonii.AAC.1
MRRARATARQQAQAHAQNEDVTPQDARHRTLRAHARTRQGHTIVGHTGRWARHGPRPEVPPPGIPPGLPTDWPPR